jgi:tetratricopeptide (TPR) repeat protein
MLTKENGFALPRTKWKLPEAKKYAFTFISLFIVLIAVYSNSFSGDWHYDDFENIVNNHYIQLKSFSWTEIKHFTYGIYHSGLSRPLSYLSFALNYKFGGVDVFGYHVVNFIIHYLAAVFLFLFIHNTLKLPLLREKYSTIAYPIALLSTFLWALNPVHVTSITYIVQRMASMAGLFYIMAMYFYLKGRSAQHSISSISFFILCLIAGSAAVFSKQNAAMLPVSILLFDLFIIQGANRENIKKFSIIFLLPFLLILIIGFIYIISFSNALSGYDIRDFSMTQRLLTEPRVVLFYLSLLFYPIGSRLSFLYDIEISRSLFEPWTTIPAILSILLIIFFSLYIARKRPLISFCIIYYFLNHLIEGSIFPLELIYEHRNYLPSMLIFVPLAEFMIFVINYFSYKKIIQFIVSCGIIIIVFGLGDITFRRNAVFANDFLLWMDNIEKYPDLSRPYSNLGKTYMDRGQKENAFHYFKKAQDLDNFGNIYIRAVNLYNLGYYYYIEGKMDNAFSYFEKSHKTISSHRRNIIYMAYIHLLKNQYKQAHQLIKEALNKYPDNAELNEIFSLILLKENNYQEAQAQSLKLLKKDSYRSFPLSVLAESARKKGNIRSAIALWKLYQETSPLNAHTNLVLIELYNQINDQEKLNQELNKFYYLKGNRTILSYLKEIEHNKKIYVYFPDIGKLKIIIKKHLNCN